MLSFVLTKQLRETDMTTEESAALFETRRQFLGRASVGIGSAALASILNPSVLSATGGFRVGGLSGFPNFAPKAKRVIYLFQNGAPSQFELFDNKPEVVRRHGDPLDPSFFQGQRLTGMTSGQKDKRICRSVFQFNKHGQSGIELGETLPYLGKVADEIAVVRSMQTQAINHDPAVTFFQTGFQQAGRPSAGAWASYGLGSENSDLPAFVVMLSQGSAKRNSQALYARLWGSGFLPSEHQGVQFRSIGDPVLYLANPKGISPERRRRMLDLGQELNRRHHERLGDPEIVTRIQQAEMAYRMQASVPELMDAKSEPNSTFALYGENARKPGTFAANCLLARRMVERGVRTIQLFHRGWDQHGSLPKLFKFQCEDIDQPAAALVKDLKRRGLLDETLVVCGGEFGRTIYSQGSLTKDNHGRDHHGRCFTTWLAGAGIRKGFEFGKTDDYSYNIVADPVHIRDLNATILNQLGVDHNRLTFRHQGLDQRLTGVEHARVVTEILS